MKHEQYDSNASYPYDDVIGQAATDVGVSRDLLRKVGWNESRFNPNAQSPTGPIGMYQFTKQTGRAMGLNISDDGSVDDRKDPKLATYAAARLLKQLTDKYHGDELKAALAYNQGEGNDGLKQLAAYDTGDFSGIKPEGIQYMKNLTDVAKSNNLELVKGFAGITPTAKPFEVDDYLKATPSTDPNAIWQPGQPVAGANIQPLPEEHQKSFNELYAEQHGGKEQPDDKGLFEGTGQAIKSNLENSVLGMAVRGNLEYSGSVMDLFKPAASGEFIPSDKDFKDWEAAGLRPEYWNVVGGGDVEHVNERLNMALENQKNDDASRAAGTGAQIIGSVAGALGDPLSYVPVAGELEGLNLVSKVAKVGAQTALVNTASEAWRTHIAGGHADYKGAVLGGLLLGGALGALHHGLSGGAEDAFSGITNRVEARETAMNTGAEDITRNPNPSPHSEHEGVKFGDATHEPEDTMLEDGSVIAGGSLADPKAIKAARDLDVYESGDKAAKGIRMGGLSEVGQVVLRSDSEELRKIGSSWFRPATGTMENGGYGVQRMTVDDIAKYLSSQNNLMHGELYKGIQKALKDPEWTHGANSHLTKEEAEEMISERIGRAIEANDNSIYSTLTEAEKHLHDMTKAELARYEDLLTDTTRFGRHDAPAALANHQTGDKYFMRAYSKDKKMIQAARFGGHEGLQRAIADSWLVDYRKNPQALDKMMEEAGVQVTPENVDKFLMDKAYGISHSEAFDSSVIVDNELRGGAGLENNNFLEARVPLRTDGVIFDQHGQPFAIDDLRDWSLSRLLPTYQRRMNGTIAIHGATGMTELENKERILNLRKQADMEGNRTLHTEVDAMMEAVRVVTGRARKDPDGVAETMMRGLTNMAFISKNAYMGVQNMTEVAALVNRGGLRTCLNGIPMFKHLAFSKGLNPDEMKTVHALLWGKELDDSLRPSMKTVIRQLREYSTAPAALVKAAGAFKWAAGEIAARSPATKILKETTNGLIDAARQNVLADITGHVHNGARSRYLTPELLKAMSVSEEHVADIENWVRKYSSMDEHGKISWNSDALRAEGRNDPAAFHLWRMGDYVASETLMRPDRLSLASAKQYGALAQMFLQFKSFTMRSLNGKFLRSYYQATKNGRAIDQALNLVTSTGLAGMYYVMQAHAKAYGLPENQREAYLKAALSMNNIGLNSMTRGSILGSPISAYNIFAQPFGMDVGGSYGRSSILASEAQAKREARPIYRAMDSEQVSDVFNGVLQQVPAINIGANMYAFGHNAIGSLMARTPAQHLDYNGALLNSAKELTPNDPITQQLVLHLIKANGMYVKPKF